MRHLCLALFAWLGAVPAEAASITLTDDPAYGCIAQLRGPIEAGDTTRLRAVLQEAARLPQFENILYVDEDFPDGRPNIGIYRPLNLCLDSPGGSLTEAMALTELVFGRLGTVIRAGARCESACALIFMAGSHGTETDFGTSVNRFLHVDGRLGFHAPSLLVPEGAYDAASVARAYAVSVAVSELIFRNMVKYRFAPSLAARMHATPAEQMFHVTRVEEAARWGIAVLGIDPPTTLNDTVIANACLNLYLSVYDLDSSDPDQWPRGIGRMDEVRRSPEGNLSYTGFGLEGAGTCAVTPDAPARRGESAVDFWGEAALIRGSVWGYADARDASPPVFFGFMQNHMAWPGEMPLAALPRNGQVQEQTTAGRCHVFRDDGTRLDEDTCIRTRRATLDGGMVDSHLWPSGTSTVLENDAGVLRVNGNPATLWYWMGDDRPESALPQCVLNDGSDNVFCFEPTE
ncbi:hypothetical protein [Maliponia aquimaris]|uniref:Lipoprotein n=1 Tax=Maliponia aquimaris TaxID=1673631 RepID=A0A238L4V8_9RHOB|nr:hypothetical protein [Maliponia aquimaris]SMX50059.1 hypothetical protein MAA8898_04581 [Maliponia aquimaris]